jgi:hypothetical protein
MAHATVHKRADGVGDNRPNTVLSVRTVETCGARFALLEDDVVAVLTLMDEGDTALDRDAVRELVSDMVLTVVSLGEQLFPACASSENKVVVLRQDDDVFGLLVERAGKPVDAVGDADETARRGDTVRLADGTELPVLDRDRLALCTLELASTALN